MIDEHCCVVGFVHCNRESNWW